MDLVSAQQARRILDRIVGYKLSPFLWKKVARGLSAGRVQSVALRLVAEREKEINSFVPDEFWKITALLEKKEKFESLLIKKDGKSLDKLEIKNKAQAEKIIKELEGSEYIVEKVNKKETKRNPLPPFTTSTLQQTAWKRLRMPARFTMGVAQKLYEKGFITYHRTDSLNLSLQSLTEAEKLIGERFGANYWNERKYKAKGRAQEAHEAIRPTYPSKDPDSLKLDKNQYKLYSLIWKRFIASQMKPAVFDSVSADVKAKNYTFRSTGQTLKFDGFLKVYPLKYEQRQMPDLEKGDKLKLLDLIPTQHFTQPPPRYTEASLIKALEEYGIGRPSTYAPIMSTIQERNYITKDDKRRFYPTEIGNVVNDILIKHFPKIVDVDFTAEMEKELDEIAEGEKEWTMVCKDFYKPFKENLEKKYEEVSKKEFTEKPTDKKCPKCGSDMLIRLGKFGRFYACSNFPECKHTEPLEKKELGIKCEKCEKGELTEKRTKRGKIFYGCNQFPKCDFALWDKPTGEKCPKCNSLLVEKGKKIKCSNKDCNFEKNLAE